MSYPEFSLDNYQVLSARTLINKQPEYDDLELSLIWNDLGLAGEAGEVVDLIKKQVCHKHGVDRELLAKELGDVLWYLAAIATKLDIKLSDVADRNIDKLKARYPEGFTFENSINRDTSKE